MMRQKHIVVLFVGVAISSIAGYWAAKRLTPPGPTVAPAGLIVVGARDIGIDPNDRSTPLEHVFLLHNPTSQVVTITDVQTGCACTTGKLESPEIQPGATVRLAVTISTFDAYKSNYKEPIWVETSAGRLELSIGGRLPPPDRVLFRPEVLYMDAVQGIPTIEREILVRVPKQCCRDLALGMVRWKGSASVSTRIVELPASELYREYTVQVAVPADGAATLEGELELETGCGPIRVMVKTSRRKLP